MFCVKHKQENNEIIIKYSIKILKRETFNPKMYGKYMVQLK